VHDAEDALQEATLRAWRGLARFEGRSSLKSWLYTIATNTSLNLIERRPKRVLPIDYGPERDAHEGLGLPLEETWVEPYPDKGLALEDGYAGPDARYELRESVELAFVSALQNLPANQRAALILREVLGFSAKDTAAALDTSVASVNSALQRARATLADKDRGATDVAAIEPEEQALVARYVEAFERYDIESLVTLLHEDAVMSMPPFDFWLQGASEMARWLQGPGAECEGSRLVPLAANGCAAFAQYRRSDSGGHTAWSIQVLEVSNGRIVGQHNFLDLELFNAFGLPLTLPA